jgi:hypothetical protein
LGVIHLKTANKHHLLSLSMTCLAQNTSIITKHLWGVFARQKVLPNCRCQFFPLP